MRAIVLRSIAAFALALLPGAGAAQIDRLLDQPRFSEVVQLYMDDRIDEARAAFDRLPDGFEARRLGVALGFDDVYEAWRVHSTAHVRVHYPAELNEAGARTFAARAEAAYDDIVAFVGAEPTKPVDYFIWPSPEAAHTAGLGNPGFALPRVGVVHSRPDQTAGHELAHVLVFQALRPRERTRFVNEGVATLFDASDRDRFTDALAAVADQRRPTRIRPMWQRGDTVPESILYPVAAAFLERLLAEGGRDAFLDLLRDQSLAGAQRIYGERLDSIIDAFEDAVGPVIAGGEPATARDPDLGPVRRAPTFARGAVEHALAGGVGLGYGLVGIGLTTSFGRGVPLTIATGVGIGGVGAAINVVYPAENFLLPGPELRFLSVAAVAAPWDTGLLFRGAWSVEIGTQTDLTSPGGLFTDLGVGVLLPFWENESGNLLVPSLRFAVGARL